MEITTPEIVVDDTPNAILSNLIHDPSDIRIEPSTRGQKRAHPLVGSRVRYTRRASGRRHGRLTDSVDYWLKQRLAIRRYMGEGAKRIYPGVPINEHQRDVISWDETGEGILVGITQRWIGKGESYASYDEWDRSFTPAGNVALYEVKTKLGSSKILVPLDYLEVLS
jgi:hypothetical protein